MILAVLKDAEIRQEKDKLISLWLKRLKDLAYEVDNVLDEFSFEWLILTQQSNSISSKMAHKIKDINEKIDKIEKDMKMFNFKVGDVNDHFKNDLDRETNARLDNSQIFGREKEKSMLIDTLIGSSNKEFLSVIPIVGIGSLGKITLAKTVYNDESIIAYFDKRTWICMSDNFSVSRLIK
ncbi:hypothetical protein NE237_030978 [Protea cynaroides]|uniref:Uncharacterized protein n=1 Tax=Protea cynaroides TaxID=273540 RepID=A0A9Q0GW34_9MAGN|nr:hypothetical protein NE237_030978 [Protea cynaroides]